jgi:hypothetical protein
MTTENIKRTITLAVWGLGILGSLWGCLLYAGAMFVVGVNDSPQEVRALTFALATPLPACILALWQRLIAGVWLVFAGAYFIYGMQIQRTYMIEVRHFADQPSVLKTVQSSLPLAGLLFALGAFGIVTGLLRWPSIWRGRNRASLQEQNL